MSLLEILKEEQKKNREENKGGINTSTHDDLELLNKLSQGVSERAKTLLDNQYLGNKSVNYNFMIENNKPNCFGTMFYTLGSEYLVKARELKEELNDEKYFKDGRGPPHITSGIAEHFFDEYCEKTKNPEDGDLIGIYHPVRHLGGLVHSGIWLGENKIFEQYNEGGPFRINKLEEEKINHFTTEFYKPIEEKINEF